MSKWAILMLVGLCISTATSGQSAETPNKAKSAPHSAAEIVKFFIDEPKKDSPYETGPLHIVYSDGTESVQTLPPYPANTDKDAVFPAVGFSGVHLADDRQTLGWTVKVGNCCTSYSIPLSVEVFRHHKLLYSFNQGLMVWDWMFVQGGKEVAIVFGTVHGPEVGDYQLYDVESGKLLSEVSGDIEIQALEADAPEWAKRLEDHYHKQ